MRVSPPRWLGHRGAILWWLGSAFIIQGAAILAGGWQPIPVPEVAVSLPRWVQALPWLVSGVVVVAGARRRHPGADAVGFAAAIVMPAVMVALWVTALAWGLTHGAPWSAAAGGAASAYTWGAIAMMILTVARWPEAPGGFVPPRDRDDDDATNAGGGDG